MKGVLIGVCRLSITHQEYKKSADQKRLANSGQSTEKRLLPVVKFRNIRKRHDRPNQIDAWRARWKVWTDAQPSGAWGCLSSRRAQAGRLRIAFPRALR
jgi:hypothetical protein